MSSPDLVVAVAREAEAQRESLVRLSARLVAAPSVNPPGDTRIAAAVLSSFFAERGVSATEISDQPTMPSVLATLDSGLPGRHLVLNVHLDTMPPGDESAWTHPVWELTRRNGRLQGLGMGNMKGAAAAMAHAFVLLQEHRAHWRGKVTFTAVSDEVVFGDHGAAHLLATMPELAADGLLCGEGPGYQRLAIGEKGVLWLALDAVGEAGHSSSVRAGISATARLSAAVSAVDALTGLRGSVDGELAGTVFANPDSALTLTVNVGTMDAGTFIGQVATRGRAELDLRLPPGISVDEAQRLVERTVARAVPDGTVRVTRIKGWDANVTSPTDRLAGAWSSAWDAITDRPLHYAIRLPASDASRWRALGVPALCYGPQPTLSAGVDDYADEDEVVRCAALYAVTALDFLGESGATREDV